MNDYDDYPLGTPDPFRQPWYARMIGRVIGAFGRLGYRLMRPVHAVGYYLGYVGSTLARKLEMSLGRVGHWLGGLWWRIARRLRLDVVERQVSSLQDTAARSVDGITSTVRQRTTEASWMRRLSERLARLVDRIGLTWARFMAWAERSWITRALTAPIRWIAPAAYTVSDFVIGWVWTRQYRHLLFGIPAFLLVMPLAYCAVRLPFYTSEAKARHYRRAVSEALVAEDHESAELYFRKLAQLGDVHEHVILRSALLAEEQGRIDDAYKKMQRIAPLDQPGDAQAHLWIAQRIASGTLEVDNPDAASLVETHLNHAVTRDLSDPALSVWLANIYYTTGRPDDCLAILSGLRRDELPWSMRVNVADMYGRLGQSERARMIAKEADEHFRKQVADKESMTAVQYVNWAGAVELTQDLTATMDVLKQGLVAFPDDTRLLQAIAAVGLQQCDQIDPRMPSGVERRFTLLSELMAIAPDSEPILFRLAQMTTAPSVADRAEQILKTSGSEGPLPASVLRTLGDVAIVKNEFTEAREHYRAALEQEPEADAALNNLAYLMANSEPKDLDEALRLASHAVRIERDNPHYLETRGQILIQLRRWTEAVDDLAVAVNGMPDKREIHASLAKAYRELGQDETAGLHAARAER